MIFFARNLFILQDDTEFKEINGLFQKKMCIPNFKEGFKSQNSEIPGGLDSEISTGYGKVRWKYSTGGYKDFLEKPIID